MVKNAPTNRICGCDLKTAGVVVAIVEFLLCMLAVYGLFRNLHFFGGPYIFWFIVGLISIAIIIFAIILLLYAIYKENARLLIPHLSAQIFIVLWLLIVAIVVGLLLFFGAYKGIRRLLGHGDYYMSEGSSRILGLLIILVYASIAVLEIFFLYIVYKLYLYLRDHKALTNTGLLYGADGRYQGGNAADPYSNEWYVPPKNERADRGGPEAGDIYPYDAPQTY